jgi:biopolymer transport protein ExbD
MKNQKLPSNIVRRRHDADDRHDVPVDRVLHGADQFHAGEQNDRIVLPDSELAKPPDAPLEYPITLHLTKEGTVIIGGEEIPITGLQPYLSREANVLRIRGKPLSDATIIIRGHKDARTGKVQELIKECQRATSKSSPCAPKKTSGTETNANRGEEKRIMKVRNSGGNKSEKVEIPMTPMIDIVFQLLVFFIMTFKIVSQEGDFNIKMPLAAMSEGPPPRQTAADGGPHASRCREAIWPRSR